MKHRFSYLFGTLGLILAASCSGSGDTTGTGGSSSTGTGGAAASTSSSGDSSSTSSGGSVDCSSASTHIEKVVCAANAFMATLSSTEKDTLLYDWTDSVAKTRWSNLPGVQRNGLKFGDLGATSKAAALAVAEQVLSAEGYSDMTGVFAADDYLGTMGMGGPGGGYSSNNYYIAFIGTPSTTGNWMFQLGGHHMAWNVTYLAGVGYPTPNHIGVEPKASFTINNTTYEPLTKEGEALVAIFGSLDASQLSAAYLKGQMFADVLLGPDEYGTGSLKNVVYPTGANRTGVNVSTLSAAQQALVTDAIAQWVKDFNPAVSDALMTAYTSADAYADTLIAWGGTEAQGVNPDVNGTYIRIDGPRVWIELACQAGVVIQGKTHYHSIYRDKTADYGSSL